MHKQFLQQAIDLAVESVRYKDGGPYGAIIVKKGEIIAASSNQVTANLDPTAHAEVMAIRQACSRLNDFNLKQCTLYTSCEPCPMCLGAIYWARIEKVYFACSQLDAAEAGFDDSFIYQELLLAPEKRKISMLHMNIANANKPFLAWQMRDNKKLY